DVGCVGRSLVADSAYLRCGSPHRLPDVGLANCGDLSGNDRAEATGKAGARAGVFHSAAGCRRPGELKQAAWGGTRPAARFHACWHIVRIELNDSKLMI